MRIRDYNPEDYNALPDVMDADESIKKDNIKVRFLEEALACFSKHNAQDEFLVILLHKHNDVGESEIMLEDEETLPSGKSALTTRKAPIREKSQDHRPCKLKFSNGEAIPIEFSSDPEASASFDALIKKEDFLKDFSRLIDKFDASNSFGIGMKNREMSRRISEDEVLAEMIDTDRVANILTAESATVAEDAIETSWSFQNDKVAAYGRYLAVTWCIVRGPGHSLEPRHFGAGDVA